jgi:hypothetical protein
VTDRNNRSNFLFGLTLTELAFILFFILLILSTLDGKEKAQDIEVYKRVFDEIPKFNEKNVEEQAKWLKELVEKDKLSVKYQELNEKHKALNDSYQKIIQGIPNLKDKSEVEKTKWLKELVEKNDLDTKNKELKKELAKIKGRAGNRHPACWEDKKGKTPEFIYDIVLSEKGITTYRGYKQYLEKEFQKIPGANNIIGTKNISINEFKQKTRSVFNWSVKIAKPECRHFVRIFDNTKSKESYKIPLRGIEHYFFKKEYRMTYSEFNNVRASSADSFNTDKKNKETVSTSKKLSQQFNKKDCISGDRNSMPRLHMKLCAGLERDRLLRGNSINKTDDSSVSNQVSSSRKNKLNKLNQSIKELNKINQTK